MQHHIYIPISSVRLIEMYDVTNLRIVNTLQIEDKLMFTSIIISFPDTYASVSNKLLGNHVKECNETLN